MKNEIQNQIKKKRSRWYDKTNKDREFTFNLDLPRISKNKKLEIEIQSEKEINLEILVYLKKVRDVDSRDFLNNMNKSKTIKSYQFKKQTPKKLKQKNKFGKILLEQWNFSCSSTGLTSGTDVNSFASSLSLVFRSIISFLKIIPTQQLVNKQKVSKTSRFIITIEKRLYSIQKEEDSTKQTTIRDPIIYSHHHYLKKEEKEQEIEKEHEINKINENEKEKQKVKEKEIEIEKKSSTTKKTEENEKKKEHEKENQKKNFSLIQKDETNEEKNRTKEEQANLKISHTSSLSSQLNSSQEPISNGQIFPRKKTVNKSKKRTDFEFAQIKNGTTNYIQIQVEHLKNVDNLLQLMNPVSYSIPKYLDLKRYKSESYLKTYLGKKTKTRRQKKKFKFSEKKESLKPIDGNEQTRQRYLNQISSPIKIQRSKNKISNFSSVEEKIRPYSYANHKTNLHSPPFQVPNSYFFHSTVGFPSYFNQQINYKTPNSSLLKDTDYQSNGSFSNSSIKKNSNIIKFNRSQTTAQTKLDIFNFQASSEKSNLNSNSKSNLYSNFNFNSNSNSNSNSNFNSKLNESSIEQEPTLEIKIQEIEPIKLDRFKKSGNSFWSVQKIINQLNNLDRSRKILKN
ncbi:hypothetical protein M0813_11395 [Anaeramoeba flamelloides]|uniref:Autophagy-related protein 13 N-terminal domain-containing protein n=1 Tax=Anaeramoeba flamelloides TaxID=1746091 RepID=A0ABQ8ZF73_9EUKA|nr:hypothetical protein M0813_11395 [Anaeramoeba flamelloides]